VIHLITSHANAAPCAELVRRVRALGGPIAVGAPARFAAGDVAFSYGASRALLGRLPPVPPGAVLINGVVQGKHEQYQRLHTAGIPVPRWMRVSGTLGPQQLLDFGGAVIVKPDLGGFGKGVRLVRDPAAFAARTLARPHVLQEYVACGGRCARVVVLGDRVAAGIDRVARDGVVAAYQHGRRGWLEPLALAPGEAELCVAAARVLGIEIAGVDLIRSDRGPFILEVNHRFVPFHLREMYGDVLKPIAAHLDARHRALCAAAGSPAAPAALPRPRPWRLPRVVTSWRGGRASKLAGSGSRLMTAEQINQRVSNARF